MNSARDCFDAQTAAGPVGTDRVCGGDKGGCYTRTAAVTTLPLRETQIGREKKFPTDLTPSTESRFHLSK